MGIKVQATQLGYYAGQLREEGSKFEIESKEELGNWMLVLDEGKAKAKAKAAAETSAEGDSLV